jgi:hypothetical protein
MCGSYKFEVSLPSQIKGNLMVQILLPTGEVKRKAASSEEIKFKGHQTQTDVIAKVSNFHNGHF